VAEKRRRARGIGGPKGVARAKLEKKQGSTKKRGSEAQNIATAAGGNTVQAHPVRSKEEGAIILGG